MFQLFLGVIDRPKESLAAALGRPKRFWLAPASFAFLSLVILSLVSAPFLAEQAKETLRQQISSLPASQAEAAMSQLSTFGSPLFMAVMAVGGGLLALLLGWLVRSAVLFLVTSLLGGDINFSQAISLILWGWLPFPWRDLVQSAYTLIHGRLIPHPGVAFLVASGDKMQDARNLAYVLLSSIDVFLLWHLVLIALGLIAGVRLARREALWTVLGYCALTTLITMIPALVGAFLVPTPLGS